MNRALKVSGVSLILVMWGCAGSGPVAKPAHVQSSARVRTSDKTRPKDTPRSLHTAESDARASAVETPAAASSADRRVIDELEKALVLYQDFIDRAGSDDRYEQAVLRSRERMQDIHDTLEFMKHGIAERER